VSTLLAVDDLAVSYGPVRAVDGVSLRVDTGAAVAVIGANGAGKTSLLMAIAGVVPPRAGRVELDGARPRAGARSASCARGSPSCPSAASSSPA
jgi:branched-chain amino acid transport system ATP-binding protein